MHGFVWHWAALPIGAVLLVACSTNHGVIDRGNGAFDISQSAYRQDSADQDILKLASEATTQNGKSRFAVLQTQTNVALTAGGRRTYTSNASVRLLDNQDTAPSDARVFVVHGASVRPE